MNHKPDENILVAYLYGELEGAEKQKVEHYLATDQEARALLQKLQDVRQMMSALEDKEVIAPPIFLEARGKPRGWNAPYVRFVAAVAASVLVIIMAARFVDLRIHYSQNQLNIGFGAPQKQKERPQVKDQITPQQVQEMINRTVTLNNNAMQANLLESQQKLDASVKRNLVANSEKINLLMRTAAAASQEQLKEYVLTLQSQNAQTVKDYFNLSASEQKQYIEELLVDFAKYLNQQRSDDFKALQARLNSIEQNTDVFKQETEQILASIITHSNTFKSKND